jgi:hypothetical protein
MLQPNRLVLLHRHHAITYLGLDIVEAVVGGVVDAEPSFIWCLPSRSAEFVSARSTVAPAAAPSLGYSCPSRLPHRSTS